MSDSSEPTVRIAEYDPLHQTLLDAVSDLENLASHPKKRSKGKLYEFVEVYDSFDSAHKALPKTSSISSAIKLQQALVKRSFTSVHSRVASQCHMSFSM